VLQAFNKQTSELVEMLFAKKNKNVRIRAFFQKNFTSFQKQENNSRSPSASNDFVH
jgi:hypothetical protein